MDRNDKCDVIADFLYGAVNNKRAYNEIVKNMAYKPDNNARNFSGCVEIINVIFAKPATIVYWSDGTKTVVKAVNEEFEPEKGLAMAIAKKAFGNSGNYYNIIKKWVKN